MRDIGYVATESGTKTLLRLQLFSENCSGFDELCSLSLLSVARRFIKNHFI